MLQVNFSISLPEILFKTTILMLQTIELFTVVFLQFLQIPYFLKASESSPWLSLPSLKFRILIIKFFSALSTSFFFLFYLDPEKCTNTIKPLFNKENIFFPQKQLENILNSFYLESVHLHKIHSFL